MYAVYDIFLNGEIIGKADLRKEGLYVHYICTCTFPTKGIFRITAETPNGAVNFGVCVPKGNCWESRGRIPANKLIGYELKLTATSCIEDKDKYIPISPEEPFALLEELENLQFTIKNGKPVVYIP